MTTTMTATTNLQDFLLARYSCHEDSSYQPAVLEAVQKLEETTVDPDTIEGMLNFETELTQDLRQVVIERIFSDCPEYLLKHMNWDGIIADWLKEENATAIEISTGWLVVWRSPAEYEEDFGEFCDENELPYEES